MGNPLPARASRAHVGRGRHARALCAGRGADCPRIFDFHDLRIRLRSRFTHSLRRRAFLVAAYLSNFVNVRSARLFDTTALRCKDPSNTIRSFRHYVSVDERLTEGAAFASSVVAIHTGTVSCHLSSPLES